VLHDYALYKSTFTLLYFTLTAGSRSFHYLVAYGLKFFWYQLSYPTFQGNPC